MYISNSKTENKLSINDTSICLKKLQENVSKLDKLEQLEIYRIITKYNNKLTENKNGIFINLTNLSNVCLKEICNFVNYSLDNKKRLNKIELMSQNILKNSILNQQYKEYNSFTHNTNNLKSPKNKKSCSQNKDISTDKKMNTHLGININDDIGLREGFQSNEYDLNEIMDNLDDENIDCQNEAVTQFMKKVNHSQDTQGPPVLNEAKPIEITYKKNKFTGKRGRLFKKCKELNKNSMSALISYSNYNNEFMELEPNDEGDDDRAPDLNELTQEQI